MRLGSDAPDAGTPVLDAGPVDAGLMAPDAPDRSHAAAGRRRAGAPRGRFAARLATVAVVLVCAAVVVAFQATRPRTASSSPAVFVPSPKFFTNVSPSFRTFVADVYWLATVQYYGEHVSTDGRLDSLPAMLRITTDLSPRFVRAYLFGAFALLDAGKAQQAYELLVRGARENPDDWQLPATVGIFIYSFANDKDKAALAAKWYEKAAQVPGHPQYLDRLAAELTQKGGEAGKAATMWAQVYAEGDKYSRSKAIDALKQILPRLTKQGRAHALATMQTMMTPADYQQLVLELSR